MLDCSGWCPGDAFEGARECCFGFVAEAVGELGHVRQGVCGEVIDLLTYLFSEVLDGRNARLTDGVQRALGREPRDFSEYARDAAATGVSDQRSVDPVVTTLPT